MSPISLSLDLLLMVMLIAALGFGWRLERRLKGLRESHADFARAVADLDRAAQRAETGLAQLRETTDETAQLLAARIEKAREMAGKLEKLTHEAVLAAQRPANDLPPATPDKRPAKPVDVVRTIESLARRLSGDDDLTLRTPAPPLPSAGASRSGVISMRSMVDDDLFEAPARVSGGMPRGRP